MLRRTMMCCVSLVVAGCAAQIVQAESLEDVKKKIGSQAQEHQTLRQEMRMTMDMPGSTGKMTSTGTMEFARRGKDKWVTRSDTVMKMPKQEGQPELGPMKTTAINDGQYLYNITDQGGQKTAMKMKADQGGQKAAADPTGFAEMEKHYDLKLLPDQKVDGKNTWVIEAKPKQDQMGGIDRVVMYYDQASGVAVKTVTYDKAGKALSTIEITKVEVDVKIPDERFTVPAGVQVTDMTAMTAPQDAGASTSQGSAQDDQATKPKPSDKAKDDSGSATPPPAQKEPAPAKPADKAKDATKKGIKGLF
jgi:outer membrane lipoprotein-sorting protein